ncbi:hypothetical protein EDC30_11264 [Paucimonas lemoignei]|uniref:Uncharacterized protein n=1 Tax=Paucimonas lemoignei TaxID=29443 RepID=A0A4R3HT84_PAULE|nr:hypothetical protein [Paucimonas lemoignei]TCS34732.1 hypothetical protein EDC30_11264 [Paucimonas lemoignei]
MDLDFQESRVMVERAREERRVAPHKAPPYVTEEGFVLYDRREGRDRRRRPEQPIAANEAELDLVAQRMQHLTAMCNYMVAQSRAQAEVAKEIGSDWYRPATMRSANGA